MRVSNITNKQGNKQANQFIIEDGNKVAFQSYNSLICEIENNHITFTRDYAYSPTTAKHRNTFLSGILGCEIKTSDVEKMIKCGSFQGYKVALLK